jgi:membrane-associated phospholipid phosphatase
MAQDAAQDVSQIAVPSPRPNFVKDVLSDQEAVWISPFKIKRGDVKWLAPIGIGAAALFATDHKISDALRPDTGLRSPSKLVSSVGNVTPLAASGSMWILGSLSHNAHTAETGRLATESLLDTGIVVQSLKMLTQRQRPDLSNHQSFPSGHTAGAFAFASVLAHEYHDKPLVVIGSYGFATAVGLSRVGGLNHFPSDVLVGAVVGELIGRYVVHHHASDRE